jgi:hypothetical protein
MANTYTLIEAKTLSTTTASVTFSSIPSTYTDLKLVYSARNNASTSVEGQDSWFYFNGAQSNRDSKVLFGTGSGTGSTTINEAAVFRLLRTLNPSNYTSSTFSNTEVYIPNYLSSNYKSFSVDGVNENNGTEAGLSFTAGIWNSTAAITSITIGAVNGNLVQYSTAYLYGISNS